MACIDNRFKECYLTLLNKLWCNYSYIYKVSSISRIYYNLFLLLLVVILMPTTHQPSTSSILVSPSPYQSRTRSFTMIDHISIVNWSLRFSDHTLCLTVALALNNTYSEDFEAATIASLFIDANRTTVVANAITTLREAIIDTVLLSSSSDRVVVAPIINHTSLFGRFGNPARKFALRSTSTFTSAIDAQVASTKTDVIIYIKIASLWVNSATYNVFFF